MRLELFATLACVAFTAASALAQGPNQPSPDSLLMLRNGEILRGTVTLVGERYHVALANGEIWIRATDAEFVCRTLDEAYQLKKAASGGPNLHNHLTLAQWCLKHGMLSAAEQELQAATHLDPMNRMAFQLSQRLRHSAHPAEEPNRPDPVPANESTAAPQKPVASSRDLDRLMAAMPRGTVEAFTTSVQPLLQNGCASAACHAPGPHTQFTIIRSGLGRAVSRRVTQRNLQAALELVNRDDPSASKLLTIPLVPHARQPAALLKDDDAAYRQLAAWVRAVTGQTVMEPTKPDPKVATSTSSAFEFGVRTDQLPLKAGPWPEGKFETTTAGVAEKPGAPQRIHVSALEHRASRFVPRDPFDPEIFNRRFHVDSDIATETEMDSATEPAIETTVE